MPAYGVEFVAHYRAWNTATNSYVTGDDGNHTLYWSKNGTASATANSPDEVDGSNAPGLYKITLTATEMQCLSGALGGVSSTGSVSLFFSDIGPVHLPNAAPASNGGLPTVNASNYIAGIAGTLNVLDDLENIAVTDILSDGTALNTSSGALDTVTDVTNEVDANITGISNDATAPDTLELFLEALDQATGQIDSGTLNGGAIDANIVEVLGTAPTETTAGRLAGNFSVFFDNDDDDTTKIVDDVGGGSFTTDDLEGLRYRLSLDGTRSAPSTTDGTLYSMNSTLTTVASNVSSIKSKTDLLGTGIVVSAGVPISDDSNNIVIYRGDDYNTTLGDELSWTTETSGEWPDLTDATITFTANKDANNANSGDDTITVTGSVAQATGANKSVTVELIDSGANGTDGLAIGRYNYDVQATTTGGFIKTLVSGVMTVLEDQTRPA